MTGTGPIGFSADDLTQFSLASHDVNPLHLSRDYARRTAYGRPVVFGVLGLLGGLGRLQLQSGLRLRTLVADFSNPMFQGVDYRVDVNHGDDGRASVKIFDGPRVVCRATATFREDSGSPASAGAAQSPTHRKVAAQFTDQQLSETPNAVGVYRADSAALAGLIERWELDSRAITPFQVAALVWSSYLIGMELPGERALFSRLKFEFNDSSPTESVPFEFEAHATSFNRAYSVVSIDAAIRVGDGELAKATLQSFVRQDVRGDDNRSLLRKVKPDARFEGRTALVIGASRGLGGAMAQCAASAGYTVYANYAKSHDKMDALRAELESEARDRLIPVKGDASDPVWARSFAEEIQRSGGSLDLLICSASPALLSLWLEPGSAERVADYIAKATALYAVPMAAFLELVTPETGWVWSISSSAVNEPLAEWPHYIAAKHANEGLVDVAAREYPKLSYLIARPPRLLTDLTNTPLGRQTALLPEEVALSLLARLAVPQPGQIQIVEEFARYSEAGDS